MDKDKMFQEVINQFAQNTERWLEIKKILEDDIRANQELIILIDQKVKQNEDKISKLN